MVRQKVAKVSKEPSSGPSNQHSDDELSSEQSDIFAEEHESDYEADKVGLRRSVRKRRPPNGITTFAEDKEPLSKPKKMARRLEVENAAKVVVQLFRDPLYLASNTKLFSADTPLGMIPGLLRKNISQSGRKRKLNPDERILLAELYQQNFTIYHNKRYFDPDYRIDISDYGNLKYWLLDDWAKKLSALGPSERSAVDIANRVHEMVMDVVEYRTQQKSKRDSVQDSNRVTAYEMSPCFFIFNKVYNYINVGNSEIETLLDRYEFTLCQMLEEKNLTNVLSRNREQLSAEEASIVCQLFSESAKEYDKQLIKKSGLSDQEGLLAGWVLQLQHAGYKRQADEIRAFIYTKRKELTQQLQNQLYQEQIKSELKKKTRRSQENTQPMKRELSPSKEVINKAIGPFTVEPIGREELFRRIRDIQIEMMAENTTPEKRETIKKETEEEDEASEDEEVSEFMEQPDKNNQATVDEPFDDVDTNESDSDVSRNISTLLEATPSTSFSLRINRPHMSRAEKRLLAMLYRQNYVDYEKYNYCRTVKSNPGNRKWILLNEWAERLTSLGVATREPQELATKIIQYKKNVSQHHEAKVKGTDHLKFANRWAKQKCTRPLTPTTRFFDVNDESMNPGEYSEKAIEEFVEEAQETRKLHTNRMGQHLHTDTMNNGLMRNWDETVENRNYIMNDYEQLEEEVDVKPPLDTLKALLSPVEQKPGPIAGLSGQLHPEMTLRDALACVEAHTTNQMEAEEDMEQGIDRKPDHPTIDLQAVFVEAIPFGQSVERPKVVEKPNDIHEMIYDDLLTMGNDRPVLLYDSVGTSGHIQRFAITRTVKERDINYFLWSKNIVLQLDMPITQYTCHMCDHMAAAAYANAMGQRRTVNGNAFLNSTQNSYLLSQQPTPSISVTGDGRLVPMEWVKTGPPKHRCVPFLKPTICEKLVELSHMLIRVEEPYLQ